MKRNYIALAASGFTAFLAVTGNSTAQTQAPLADYQVVDRGEHHRVWERVSAETMPDGRTVQRKHAYIELADHLCYFDEEAGQWADSQEVIEIVNEHGIARHGAHKVIFAPNINSYGAIEVFAPDKKRFRLHPLALAYTDRTSGDAVLIAEIKDSTGEVTQNQVLYPDCFTDGLAGSIQYVYTRSGIEQNVILQCIPPDPYAAYGMDPETTVLEVITEVVTAPEPSKTLNVLSRETHVALRQLMAEPDLVDEVLQFGAMSMPTGSAFPLNRRMDMELAVPTAKSWEVREGRQVLIEKVEYRAIRSHLEGLPQAGLEKKSKGRLQAKVVHPKEKQVPARPLPPAPARQARNPKATKPLQTALRQRLEKGYVLDYSVLNTSSLTNYTFQGGSTYFVNGNVTLRGLTTIEGGTVIKYTNYTANPKLSIYGEIDCQTSPYRPAIFTAKDDDTVGEIIVGSSKSPSSFYAYNALSLPTSGTNYFYLHDLSMRYAYYGILSGAASTAYEFRNCQVGKGYVGIQFASDCTVRNVLFHDLTRALYPYGSARGSGQHITAHRVPLLFYDTNYSTSFHLTNCLLIAVTNNLIFGNACNVVTNQNDTGVFQTVLGGQHYLADNSPYRDCGTTNINPDLLKDLRVRTTYPPLYLTNPVTLDTVLAPQASRDQADPDLGYHYQPIDYLAACMVSNATLLLTNGVSLSAFKFYGLYLQQSTKLISEGTPINPNHFTFYSMLQETPTNGMSSSDYYIMPYANSNAAAAPELRCRFTSFDIPPAGGYPVYGDNSAYPFVFTNLSFRDCQLSGGTILLYDATLGGCGFTNNLFNRLAIYGVDLARTDWFNNLFRHVDGYLFYVNRTNCVGTFKDNLLDQCTLINFLPTLTNDYNAYYLSSDFYSEYTTNIHDKVLTNLTYQPGPLGLHYYSNNMAALFDTGSRNATNAGLYHYTTTINQVPETNSMVDIGFHYVAVDANGNPLDYDSDGVPDYIEDANGNGVLDPGETDWQNGTDLRVYILRPKASSEVP